MFIASVCPSVCLSVHPSICPSVRPSVRPSVCLKPKFGLLKTKFDDDSDEKTKGALGYPMDRGFPWIFDFHGWLFWGVFDCVKNSHG